MKTNQKKFVVIDGNAIIHKSFHGVPPFKTSKGELVNAVYGFSSMLLAILDREKPHYIAVSFDKKGRTFRHELSEDYKATRVKAPDELYQQIPRVREVVCAFEIPIFEESGFEADDVIGTLARLTKKYGNVVTMIVTGDLDTVQLVDNQTIVAALINGGGHKIKYYDAEAVLERYGVLPEQIVDYKALVGDSSDNIAGVPGIGPKTASGLLQKYKTLTGIYERLVELPVSVQKKLSDNQGLAFLSQSLARIVCDVPLEFDIKKCVTHEFDIEKVRKVFEELEFKSLQKRTNEIFKDKNIPTLGKIISEQMTMF